MSFIMGIELHNMGPVERIPLGEGRTYRLDGEEVAVFRTRQGEVFAVQARCPHRGGPLADGLVGGGRVLCPLHGHAFELATGDAVNNRCTALRRYRVSVTAAGDLLLGAHSAEIALAD
jgi:nitrite reductase (NADH) small subunit